MLLFGATTVSIRLCVAKHSLTQIESPFFLFLVFGEPFHVFSRYLSFDKDASTDKKRKTDSLTAVVESNDTVGFCVKRQVEKARSAVTILRFLRLLFPVFVLVSLFKYFTLRTQRKGEGKKKACLKSSAYPLPPHHHTNNTAALFCFKLQCAMLLGHR